MQCINKKDIRNPKTGKPMEVPCGKCNFCLANRRNDWAIRMEWENKISLGSAFVTLTYDNEHVPRRRNKQLTLKKSHLYRFIKSLKQQQRIYLRKQYWKEYEKEWRIRYFAVGEYGSNGTNRPHYHLILFNIHFDILEDLQRGRIWKKGMVHVGNVSIKSAAYCAKYMIDKEKNDKLDKRQKPFATMSRNPGIGLYYVECNRNFHRPHGTYHPDEMRMYLEVEGQKRRMPVYWKRKIFQPAEDERPEILQLGKEIHIEELLQKMAEEEKLELARLAKYHPNPVLYRQQQIQQYHDQIRIKSLKLNTL